jgi:hypothetical protein
MHGFGVIQHLLHTRVYSAVILKTSDKMLTDPVYQYCLGINKKSPSICLGFPVFWVLADWAKM